MALKPMEGQEQNHFGLDMETLSRMGNGLMPECGHVVRGQLSPAALTMTRGKGGQDQPVLRCPEPEGQCRALSAATV